jgi:D-beta-D-heptose 7-phosphate kinase/D-beta-D-heptose 1-phosphate adenosyltransferase
VIVPTERLHELRGAVAMVDGGFDPLHAGHVAYFREASLLGLPVLCNVAPDEWVARKHPPLLAQAERAAVIDALRDVAYTHLAPGSTREVLELLAPRYYVKGGDWRGRLPAEELEACAHAGIEVVLLDTVTNSSTALLERWREQWTHAL